MEDKYGYARLKNTLENIANKLNDDGYKDLANEVLHSSKFYGGMPSEFLGESWIALKLVLEHRKDLPKETIDLVESTYKEIVLSFERVGQKLPK